MKKQTEYTFEEARKEATHSLSALAKFAENLHNKTFDQSLFQSAITLRTIEIKARNSSEPCLSDSEIKQVQSFGQQLIQFHPDIKSQLNQLWDLYHDVFRKLRSTKTSPGYALRGEISKLRRRIQRADVLAERIVSAVQSKVSNILSPAALLLVHIVRTETIEYAIVEQLSDAVKKHGLQSKYDIEAICSVQSKVKKGSEWRTDVRAIRDATAHRWFKIRLSKNDWAMKFDNDEKGYTFHKQFSRKEFTRFFDLHTLLYKLQLHLLIVLELLPILTTHLRKQA